MIKENPGYRTKLNIHLYEPEDKNKIEILIYSYIYKYQNGIE